MSQPSAALDPVDPPSAIPRRSFRMHRQIYTLATALLLLLVSAVAAVAVCVPLETLPEYQAADSTTTTLTL